MKRYVDEWSTYTRSEPSIHEKVGHHARPWWHMTTSFYVSTLPRIGAGASGDLWDSSHKLSHRTASAQCEGLRVLKTTFYSERYIHNLVGASYAMTAMISFGMIRSIQWQLYRTVFCGRPTKQMRAGEPKPMVRNRVQVLVTWVLIWVWALWYDCPLRVTCLSLCLLVGHLTAIGWSNSER